MDTMYRLLKDLFTISRDVVRCVPNDFVGGHTLAAVRCPTGLLFDLDGQVCDWAHRVSNCDKLTKPRNARPNFKTQVFDIHIFLLASPVRDKPSVSGKEYM
jgi:hypothetical protein